MKYRIGSFNLRDFNFANRSSDGEDIQRDFKKIADIIISEKFDVVALQEVNSKMALEELTRILNRQKNLSREYDSRFGEDTPKNRCSDGRDPERFGFIWNIKRLELLTIPNKKNPTYYQNAGAWNLIRKPYVGRFTARGKLNGSNIELRLVNTHIKSMSSGSKEELIKEFNILVQQILPRICESPELPADGACMPAYTFLMGDYNLCLNEGTRVQFKIEQITPTSFTGRKKYYKTVLEEPTSLRMPNEQQTIPECYANNFDHFTYETELEKKLGLTSKRVEALEEYFPSENNACEKLSVYRKKVSDHVPIKLTVDLKK